MAQKLYWKKCSLTWLLKWGFLSVTREPAFQNADVLWLPEDRLNIEMASYQHRHSHYTDKMVARQSYFCNGNSPYLERPSLFWDGAQTQNSCYFQCWFSAAPSPAPDFRRKSMPEDTNATEGSDVIFECRTDAEPHSDVQWMVNGVILNRM